MLIHNTTTWVGLVHAKPSEKRKSQKTTYHTIWFYVY